jgi:hypothetical protein
VKLAAALVLAAAASGCMSVDATVEAVIAGPGLSFMEGGAWAGQLMSETQTVPIKLKSPLLRELASAEIESVTLRPTGGVHTLDFFHGISLIAHSDGSPPVPLVSLGPAELVPDADGSLTLPVQVVLEPSYFTGLSIEATIQFVVPGEDWSLSEDFALQLTGSTTLGP